MCNNPCADIEDPGLGPAYIDGKPTSRTIYELGQIHWISIDADDHETACYEVIARKEVDTLPAVA